MYDFEEENLNFNLTSKTRRTQQIQDLNYLEKSIEIVKFIITKLERQ